jgi:hypothetical protein
VAPIGAAAGGAGGGGGRHVDADVEQAVEGGGVEGTDDDR